MQREDILELLERNNGLRPEYSSERAKIIEKSASARTVVTSENAL